MGIRGPKLTGTGNIKSISAWYAIFEINHDYVDSITFEASLYQSNLKTLRQVRAWRGYGAAEWSRLQSEGFPGAFCGGQSA